MSRRTRKDDANTVEEKSAQELAQAEIEAANEQAIKDAEAASKTEEKVEEKPGLSLSNPLPEACEVWGCADQNSRSCKKCPVLKECLELTAMSRTKTTTAKVSTPRKPREAGNGQFSVFGHCRANSQAGIIEAALVTPRTIAELEAETGCTASRIKNHINWLVKKHGDRCTKIEEKGKIHFALKG